MTVIIDRKKIVKTRYDKGFGVKELAAIAGVSHVTIINIENGRVEATPKTLKKVCAALNLNMSDVVTVVA